MPSSDAHLHAVADATEQRREAGEHERGRRGEADVGEPHRERAGVSIAPSGRRAQRAKTRLPTTAPAPQIASSSP